MALYLDIDQGEEVTIGEGADATNGTITKPENDKGHLKDLRVDEVILMLPLVFLFFIIGLFPNLFFDKINPSVEAMVAQQQARIEQGSIVENPLEHLSNLFIAETMGK